MAFWISFSIILSLITLISILIDPVRFRNGVIFLFTLASWVITLMVYVFENPYSLAQGIFITLIILIPLIYGLIMIFLFINGIIVILREGFSFSHSLSLLLSLFMLIVPVGIMVLLYLRMNVTKVHLLFCLLTLTFFFMITFGGFFCYSLLYCIVPRRLKCTYIIIHGAGLAGDGTITPLLKRRIDKALLIYKKCKIKPTIIPSGGKGSDEKLSEAEAMANYLLNKGIPKSNIILENKSRNTYENLKFTQALLNEIQGNKPYSCIFVTNNYHVLRTAIYARKLKLNAKGIGCRTAGYYLPSAFLREYIAVMKMNKKTLLLLAIILILEFKLI